MRSFSRSYMSTPTRRATVLQGRINNFAHPIKKVMDDADEEYLIPLEDQRVFGAGIKRKRVAFIPAGTLSNAQPQHIETPSATVAERYLSIVLKDDGDNGSTAGKIYKGDAVGADSRTVTEASSQTLSTAEPVLCEICHLPLNQQKESFLTNPEESHVHHAAPRPHEASLPHQISLPHSHPPSHLPRSHPGLKYLSSYGWDPDSRLGLGITGEGIRVPIKGKVKNDTAGLGVDATIKKMAGREAQEDKRPERLHAGKVRRSEEMAKKKAERLRQMFYARDDVERLLGHGG